MTSGLSTASLASPATGRGKPAGASVLVLVAAAGAGAALGWFGASSLGLAGQDRATAALVVGLGGLLGGASGGGSSVAVLRRRLPDTLDLLATCVEAGLAPAEAVARTCAAVERVDPASASELRSISEGGKPRLPEAREVAEALRQARLEGAPMAPTLRQVANTLRAAHRAEITRWASRLPTLVGLAVFVFVVPAVFAFVLGPSLLQAVNLGL